MSNYYTRLHQISALVLDIDGVLTDNRILVTDSGEFLRIMNVRDGYAIKRAIQAEIKIAIISGGKSQGTFKRLQLLGVDEIHLGIENKIQVLESLISKWDIAAKNIAYMGDDIMDIDCLRHVGLSTCPKDSVPEVLNICDYISEFEGGAGCVRDIIVKILQAKNKW